MSNEVTILSKVREARLPRLDLLVRVFDMELGNVPIPQEIDSFELFGNTDFLSKEFDRYIDGTTQIRLGNGCIELDNSKIKISVVITGDKHNLIHELFGKIRRRWL